MGGVLNLGKAFHDELTGKIVVVMVFLVFFAVAFVIFLHLYAKYCCIQHSSSATATATTTSRVVIRRRRVDFSPGYYVESSSSSSISAVHHRGGLDPTVLDSIPVMTFEGHQKGGGMECAVCLSDVSEGEKLRILPKCHHGFHVECIDMWFHSHQTCPLCRIIIDTNPNPNSSQTTTTLDSILQATMTQNTTTVTFPTNVLFWGNHTQQEEALSNNDDDVDQEELINVATSSTSGTVAIDMPRQAVVQEEEEQAVGVVTVRLRSLRRLLTRDRTLLYPSCTTTADTTIQL